MTTKTPAAAVTPTPRTAAPGVPPPPQTPRRGTYPKHGARRPTLAQGASKASGGTREGPRVVCAEGGPPGR